jgi:hypothetical protein
VTRPAGETAATMGRNIASRARWARDEESQQLGRDLDHAAEVLGLSGRGSAVGREAMGRWIGADAEDIEAWSRGRTAIPVVQAERVRAFVEMATTLEDTIRGDRLPMILATRPVLMLGGRTYFQALNDGAPIEVVADSARLALGAERVETEAGQAYVARRTTVLWEPGTTPPARRRKPAAKTTTRTTRARS